MNLNFWWSYVANSFSISYLVFMRDYYFFFFKLITFFQVSVLVLIYTSNYNLSWALLRLILSLVFVLVYTSNVTLHFSFKGCLACKLELKGNRYVLGEFLQFKGNEAKSKDKHVWASLWNFIFLLYFL
jgi:hypothetical protein